MKRRTAIKQFSAITAGLALLPSCSDGLLINLADNATISFSPDQATWLSAISQAILPTAGQSIKTLEDFPSFVKTRLSLLASEKQRGSFINGYNTATQRLKENFSKSSDKITPEEVISFFAEATSAGITETQDEARIKQQDLLAFIGTIKSLSVKHLTTSQTYMQDRLEYNILPGKYQGCIPV